MCWNRVILQPVPHLEWLPFKRPTSNLLCGLYWTSSTDSLNLWAGQSCKCGNFVVQGQQSISNISRLIMDQPNEKTALQWITQSSCGHFFRCFSSCFLPGRVLKKVLYGGAPPRGPTPYPFIYHFFRKGTPFVYLLLEKGTPFIYLLKKTYE